MVVMPIFVTGVHALTVPLPSVMSSSPSGTPGPSGGAASSPRNTAMRGYRQRALKDYQIMLEFRHLKLHAPAGVYILPSFDSLREWSGVLFVRSGVYKGGIFRFSMQLPRSYPANGACPRVLFQSRVFHPHVHPQTGQVDILSHFGGHWVAFGVPWRACGRPLDSISIKKWMIKSMPKTISEKT